MTAKFSLECEFVVEGVFHPYRPGTPPSYASGGDPPEAAFAEAEDISAFGIITYNSEKRQHVTTWLPISKSVLEELSKVLLSNPSIRDLADDAIIEEHMR